MDRNNWQLYKDGEYWYFNVWDAVRKEWWISEPFGNYDDACAARDTMINDTGA